MIGTFQELTHFYTIKVDQDIKVPNLCNLYEYGYWKMCKTFILHTLKVKKLAAKHLPAYFETPCTLQYKENVWPRWTTQIYTKIFNSITHIWFPFTTQWFVNLWLVTPIFMTANALLRMPNATSNKLKVMIKTFLKKQSCQT